MCIRDSSLAERSRDFRNTRDLFAVVHLNERADVDRHSDGLVAARGPVRDDALAAETELAREPQLVLRDHLRAGAARVNSLEHRGHRVRLVRVEALDASCAAPR